MLARERLRLPEVVSDDVGPEWWMRSNRLLGIPVSPDIQALRSYIDPRIFSLYAAGHSIELDHLPDGSWHRRAELEARVLATPRASRVRMVFAGQEVCLGGPSARPPRNRAVAPECRR